MFRNHKTPIAGITAMTVAAMLLAAGPTAALAGTITYKGVSFEFDGDAGNATVDNGNLILRPTSDKFAVHTNRIPDNGNDPSPINANNTPFIRFSYQYSGGIEEIYGFVQDEAADGAPRVQAGSIFGVAKVASATYGTGDARNANETYLFFEDTPAAAMASHDVLLGRTADGTLYVGFDGEVHSSNIFKAAGIDFDFNDFYLKAQKASGSKIVFTDLAYGDDFSPPSAAVPGPSSLLLLSFALSLVMIGMLICRRRDFS